MHFPITRTFLIYHTVIPTSETFFKEVTYAVIYITQSTYLLLCITIIYVHILNITFIHEYSTFYVTFTYMYRYVSKYFLLYITKLMWHNVFF